MGVQYQFAKRYQNFFGFDLRSNDLEFPEQRATDVDNIQYTPTGTLEKRVGYQAYAEPEAKYGIFQYNRVDENGVEQPEVLGISDTVVKLSKTEMVVTYSGAEIVSNIQIFFDVATSQFRCQLNAGTLQPLDYALGVGIDDVSPVTITALAAAINATAGFSAVVTGDGTVPAAFIKAVPLTSLYSSPFTCEAGYWEAVNASPQTGKSGPFAGSVTNENEANFENVTSVQIDNAIYFSNGYDPVIKYDGQNAYRAGLPPSSDGADGTYTVSAGGASAGARYYVWKTQYVQVDNNGIYVEGNPFQSSLVQRPEPSATPIVITCSNIPANSGFNTNCALVSGSGTGTVIPVTVGHTIKAGDTAYMWDTGTSTYVTRSVVSVTSLSVTVDSSIGYTNSTTSNQNVISNNLRLRVMRSKDTGSATLQPTLFFEIIEIPNNSIGANNVFTDTVDDDLLLSQFLEPVTDRSPPVKGRYISAYQNIMVTAGNLTAPNEVSFSDISSPEYFPLGSNQFTVTNLQGDKITGIFPSNESFIIFQSRAIHAVTGDVPNQTFRVDTITQDIGCAAHASIQDVRGTICFLSLSGPRALSGASVPKGLGQAKDSEFNSRIDPLFNQYGLSSDQILRNKRAVGINYRKGEKYMIFIPAEDIAGGVRYTNSNSVMIVYDYTRDAWVKWSNFNCTGGMTLADSENEFLFIERRDADPSSGTTDIKTYVYRFQNSGTSLDYQDHDQAIAAYHKSPWEFMGEAGILKNFERIKVYSSEALDSQFTLDINTEKDFIPDVPISTCSLSFGDEGYAHNAWDTAQYGDPATAGLKHKLSNGRCVSLRVILSNSEPQTNIAITGYELEVATPYKPGFKI